MNKASRLEKIAWLLLILLAMVLRFYRLGVPDIWGDEAFSIWLSKQPLSFVIAGASDTHPPFYPFSLFLWLKVLGASAFATRALSALVGVGAVPLIFVLAKRLTSRPRVKWLAALLVTVAPLMIYYSQETRMYELVAVLALWSAYLMLHVTDLLSANDANDANKKQNIRGNPGTARQGRCSRDSRLKRTLIFYVIITLLAMYTHYSAFFILVAQNNFAFIALRKNRGALIRWLAIQLLLALAYVPWIIVQSAFLRGKASARFDEWGWRGIEMIFGKTLLAFSAGLTVDFPLPQIATALFVVFAVLGMYAIALRKESLAWFAPIYFIAPVFIAYLVNPIMPFFFERYVLAALPGFLILVALGLDYLDRIDHRAQIGFTFALVMIGVYAQTNYYFDDAYAKGKYGTMMAYVARNAQPGDVLILNNPLQMPLYEYYAPQNVPAYFFPDGASSLEEPSVRQKLSDVAGKSSRVWLVMFGNSAEYDPTGYLDKWFGARAFKSYFGGYVDASLALYVMPNAQPAIRQSLNYKFGDAIRLTGYDLDRADAVPGQALLLTLHWRASAAIDKRYTVFAHIIGGENPATKSPVWAQMDSEPMGGSRPTDAWRANESIDDRYGLLLDANTPPGEYQIEIGMYDSATVTRLPIVDAGGQRLQDDRVILGAVRVVAR